MTNKLGGHHVVQLDLVLLQQLYHLLVSSQEAAASPVVSLLGEVHHVPLGVQFRYQLLHGQLLAGFIHNVLDLVLEVVEVEAEEFGQSGLVRHGEADLSGLHQLGPVTCPGGKVNM